MNQLNAGWKMDFSAIAKSIAEESLKNYFNPNALASGGAGDGKSAAASTPSAPPTTGTQTPKIAKTPGTLGAVLDFDKMSVQELISAVSIFINKLESSKAKEKIDGIKGLNDGLKKKTDALAALYAVQKDEDGKGDLSDYFKKYPGKADEINAALKDAGLNPFLTPEQEASQKLIESQINTLKNLKVPIPAALTDAVKKFGQIHSGTTGGQLAAAIKKVEGGIQSTQQDLQMQMNDLQVTQQTISMATNMGTSGSKQASDALLGVGQHF